MLSNAVITCRSKQQYSESKTLKVSEFTALLVYVKEVLSHKKLAKFCKNVLLKTDVEPLFNISIREDKLAGIEGLIVSAVSELSKHFDMKYQVLLDDVEKGDGVYYTL